MYPRSTVEELRVGSVKRMFSINVETAIDKSPRPHASVNKLGLFGDSHVYVKHGGEERAVLQFDSDKYPGLARVFPDSSDRFFTGAFGENIVASGMNEQNMCIGDIVRVGSVVLQVTQPRQPCAKLKYRFDEPTMPLYTQSNAATGWFYRVLTEGDITVGDEIVVVERPHQEWPIARVQHYLYIETDNQAATEELSGLGPLGDEVRSVFVHRLENNEVEDWSSRISAENWGTENAVGRVDNVNEFVVRIEKIIDEFARVKRFVLARMDSEPLPDFTAGAHIVLHLPNGLLRTYSLCAPLGDADAYQISVALAPDSRGGSEYLHDKAKVGDVLTISKPGNLFEMTRDDHHVFVAGGIGITPFFSMIAEAESNGESYELHYCVDSTEDYAFAEQVAAYGDKIKVYSLDEPLEIEALLSQVQSERTHAYACGSPGFVDWVVGGAQGWSEDNLHFENFSVDRSDDEPFVATVVETGQDIDVDSDTTLLEALRLNGLEVPSNCEVGICGTCRISYGGEVDHRDTYLTKSEQKKWMTSCVSRAKGSELRVSMAELTVAPDDRTLAPSKQ